MSDMPEKSFWHDLSGLGGWLPIITVCRASGMQDGYLRNGAHAVAQFLRRKGLPVRRAGRRNLNWMRKSDCPALTEHFADSISARIARFDPRSRTDVFETLDREEFADMDLVEIFDALAADIRHTMQALSKETRPHEEG